jgi:hypothetical protein
MSKLWTDIFNSNRFIPPASYRQPAEGSTPDCYAISIRGAEVPKVRFLSFPPFVYHWRFQLDQHCVYQLRACFYDAGFGKFFGKPWQGRWIEGQQQRLVFDEVLFIVLY